MTLFQEANGFMHVNEAKMWWGRTLYPLHVAVQQKKQAIVKARWVKIHSGRDEFGWVTGPGLAVVGRAT